MLPTRFADYRSNMNRRTFLRVGGLSGAALLAGCGNGGNSDNTASNGSGDTGTAGAGTTSGDTTSGETVKSGVTTQSNADGETKTGLEEPATTQKSPAQFSNAALEGPQNVTVGEDFTLPFSVANSGGQNGTFNGTLTVAEGSASFNRSVAIEGVQPGSTANESVGPINISSADNYTLAMEGTNTTHELQVNPIEKQPGSSITANNLKVTVQGIRLTPALFYAVDVGLAANDGTEPALLSAGSGKMLCVIRIGLENVGTDQARFAIPSASGNIFSGSSGGSAAVLTLPNGTLYTGLPNDRVLGQMQGVEGDPLTNVQLNAGQTKSGWLIAQLPRSAASKTVRVGYQGNAKNSPPETIWPFPPKNGSKRPLPKFTLDAFEMPDTARLGGQDSYTIRVSNTGDGAGTYRSVTQFKGPESRNWNSYNKQETEIGPSKSTTFEHPIAYPSDPKLGEAQFRLQPFGKTVPVTFDTTELTFGQIFNGPSGQNITVGDVQQADSYQLDGGGSVTPDEGKHFVFARISVEFVEQNDRTVPIAQFNLVREGATYEPEYIISADRFTKPVQANVLVGNMEGPKGSSKSGYVVYSVPQSVTPSNSRIFWSADEPWVRWQSG